MNLPFLLKGETLIKSALSKFTSVKEDLQRGKDLCTVTINKTLTDLERQKEEFRKKQEDSQVLVERMRMFITQAEKTMRGIDKILEG